MTAIPQPVVGGSRSRVGTVRNLCVFLGVASTVSSAASSAVSWAGSTLSDGYHAGVDAVSAGWHATQSFASSLYHDYVGRAVAAAQSWLSFPRCSGRVGCVDHAAVVVS